MEEKCIAEIFWVFIHRTARISGSVRIIPEWKGLIESNSGSRFVLHVNLFTSIFVKNTGL